MGRRLAGRGRLGWLEIITAEKIVSQIEDWLIDSLDTQNAISN
jgi:hypothetical protein